MKQYWLTIKLKPHATCPVSHGSAIWLKAYFDENPNACDTGEHHVGRGIRVPAEKTSVKQLLPQGEQVFHFSLTEAEFNAASFDLYVWVEPYGAAALRLPGVMADKAAGRLLLKPAHVKKGGLPFPPPNSQPVDEQIVVETVELANSVAQWVAEQMNTNAASAKTALMKKLADQEKAAQQQFKDASYAMSNGGFFERLGASQIMESQATLAANSNLARRFIMGRAGHPDDELAQYGGLKKAIKGGKFEKWLTARGLDVVLLGDGDWDLKPRISTIWGDINRLGNREYYITSDNFSNLHYGYVAGASGFTAVEANELADFEGDDTPEDKIITWKGVQFYEQKKIITWQNITLLVERMAEIHIYG